MRDILLFDHIGVGFPELTIHETSSCRVANYIRLFGHLFAAVGLSDVPKLQNHNGNHLLVRSEAQEFSYRHGQGLRRELFDNNIGTDLVACGCLRLWALPWVDV